MSANRGSNIQCLFLTVGQCTTSKSAIIGQGSFGTVPFSLPLVPDCLCCNVLFLVSVYRGIPLDSIFNFIVNYANIMLGTD